MVLLGFVVSPLSHCNFDVCVMVFHCALQPCGKGKRLPEVHCIISRLGCFSLFAKVWGISIVPYRDNVVCMTDNVLQTTTMSLVKY